MVILGKKMSNLDFIIFVDLEILVNEVVCLKVIVILLFKVIG